MMTTRVRNENSPDASETFVKYWNGNYFDALNHVSLRQLKEMTDTVVPRYHERIAAGEIINNFCQLESEYRETGEGYYYAHDSAYSNVFEGSGGSLTMYQLKVCPTVTEYGYPDRSYDINYMIDVAKQKAIKNIDPTPYAFMEDAFEIRETINFLKNPVRGLLNLGTSFQKAYRQKRASWRPGVKIADELSNTWLEYRFAASPLIRSVQSAAEALEDKLQEVDPPRKTARGIMREETRLNTVDRYMFDAEAFQDFRKTLDASADISAGIIYEVSNPVRDLSFKLGLRAKDIPETMWQIVPLSFMVDRVLDISGMIRGITNLLDPNVRILAGWVRAKEALDTSIIAETQYIPGYTITMDADLVLDKKFVYQRTPWLPSVSDTLPSANARGLVKDATSLLDLLTLTYSRLRG